MEIQNDKIGELRTEDNRKERVNIMSFASKRKARIIRTRDEDDDAPDVPASSTSGSTNKCKCRQLYITLLITYLKIANTVI